MRHRTVRARGLEFHVAEAGSGEDVVLCLHGWPQHWYEWRHLVPALADRHRVIRTVLIAGYEAHADDMEVEYVEDCGHFIADEKPDPVAARAQAFFAPA